MRCRYAVAAVALMALPVHAADAAGIEVLTAGAFKPVVVALAPGFTSRNGDKVAIANDTVGALTRRIGGGARCDVAILTKGALAALAAQGAIAAGSARDVARVGIGVAVLKGRPKPDISTVAAFRATVLAAPSVAYLDPAAGGSSGIYLAQLFKRLGIADQVAAKAVLVPGGTVADKLVDGKAALAIHQISEILPIEGVSLVGPLPPAIQNYTDYAAGVCTKAGNVEAARAFIARLRGRDARRLLAAKGMEPAT